MPGQMPQPRPVGTGLALLLAVAVVAPLGLRAHETPSSLGPGADDPECFVADMDLEGRTSPLDSATVELGGETAKVCYGAPSARGRTMIGGDEVPHGEAWRMGANEATAIHLPFSARLGEVELEPGSYSLYAIPGQEEWTVVVNGQVERWGIPIDPDVTAQDLGEIRVPRERPEAHVETLTFTFGEPTADGVELVMEWEEYRITLPLHRTDG